MQNTTAQRFEASEAAREYSLAERDALTAYEMDAYWEMEAEYRAELAAERAIESPDPDYYAAELAAGR